MENNTIEYTIEEIKILVEIYQEEFPLDDLEIQENKSNYDFSIILEGIISLEKRDPRKVLIEFINNRDFVSLNNDDHKLLLKLLFNTPLIEMPKLINYSDTESWKSKIARWRLKIGK